VSRRVPLFLLICICTGSLFAPHVCNSEQTPVLEQIRVAWHESGRSLADGGHPRDGQSQERAHSFCIVPMGSNPWGAAKFSRNCRTSPLGSNPKKTA
jgi:hypothetical protein